MAQFKLDPRLAADTIHIGESALSKILLMNDSRWPWIILVPRIVGVSEIYELSETQQEGLAAEVIRTSKAIKSITNCKKINLGALGNIVAQLHVHVIARSEGDPNWPGPVWGFGNRIPYEEKTIKKLRADIIELLSSKLL